MTPIIFWNMRGVIAVTCCFLILALELAMSDGKKPDKLTATAGLLPSLMLLWAAWL